MQMTFPGATGGSSTSSSSARTSPLAAASASQASAVGAKPRGPEGPASTTRSPSSRPMRASPAWRKRTAAVAPWLWLMRAPRKTGGVADATAPSPTPIYHTPRRAGAGRAAQHDPGGLRVVAERGVDVAHRRVGQRVLGLEQLEAGVDRPGDRGPLERTADAAAPPGAEHAGHGVEADGR